MAQPRAPTRLQHAFALLCAALLAACGAIDVASPDAAATRFATDARLRTPAQLPAVEVSIVKTAETKTIEAFTYSGGAWFTPRVVAHSAVLVRHPRGAFLFDTGLGARVDQQFGESMPYWLRPLMAYELKGSAQALLAANGEKAPITRLVLSHLHWDHASGIKDFPDAEIWATPEEREWAMNPAAPEGPFIRSQYSGDKVKWHPIEFTPTPYENFERSLDMFGDGSVVLVPLPGHTPGAIGMFVNLRSGKRLLFSGDTTWAREGIRLPAHKFWISSWLVDHDKAATERSILKLHWLAKHYPDLQIIPAHDDQAQAAVGFYPKFMD